MEFPQFVPSPCGILTVRYQTNAGTQDQMACLPLTSRAQVESNWRALPNSPPIGGPGILTCRYRVDTLSFEDLAHISGGGPNPSQPIPEFSVKPILGHIVKTCQTQTRTFDMWIYISCAVVLILLLLLVIVR